MGTRTRAERRDELIEALGHPQMDMLRLHYILSIWPGMADVVEGVIAQTDRTHGEVAAAYVAWARGPVAATVASRQAINRITILLAQAPLIPLSAVTALNRSA